MTAAEYLSSALGRNWDRIAFNCFDAVRESFRHIDGIILRNTDDPDEGVRDYVECQRSEGVIFNCYGKNGEWLHVGRVLNGKAYHAIEGGETCLWDLDTLERYWKIKGGYVKYCKPRLDNGAHTSI